MKIGEYVLKIYTRNEDVLIGKIIDIGDGITETKNMFKVKIIFCKGTGYFYKLTKGDKYWASNRVDTKTIIFSDTLQEVMDKYFIEEL